MTQPTYDLDALEATFKKAWARADEAGATGSRTKLGLLAVLDELPASVPARPIQVGDLVQGIRPNIGGRGARGYVKCIDEDDPVAKYDIDPDPAAHDGVWHADATLITPKELL